MRKITCLIAALVAIVSCATTNTQLQNLRTHRGRVGVISALPRGFEPVEAPDSPSAVFVSLDIPAVIEVTDLPIPAKEMPNESSHRTVMDTYSASMTRNPGDALVSARSLFWNDDRHIGAFEIIYTEPSERLGPVQNVLRVVRIATKKGTRSIALRKSGAISESFNAAWDEIVAHISVEETAQLGMD